MPRYSRDRIVGIDHDAVNGDVRESRVSSAVERLPGRTAISAAKDVSAAEVAIGRVDRIGAFCGSNATEVTQPMRGSVEPHSVCAVASSAPA